MLIGIVRSQWLPPIAHSEKPHYRLCAERGLLVNRVQVHLGHRDLTDAAAGHSRQLEALISAEAGE